MNANALSTTPATSMHFIELADTASSRNFIGTLLKFVKGEYVVGKMTDGKTLPLGTELVAVMPTASLFWQKWFDGHPVDGGYRPISGGRPYRDELGGDDQGLWELDAAGKPKDPWSKTGEIVFIAPDGSEAYTFSTSSQGGLDALGKLARAHARALAKNPDGYPLIKLGAGSYIHAKKEIGKVWFPTFDVVETVAAGRYNALLAASFGVSIEEAAPAKEQAAKPRLVTISGPAVHEEGPQQPMAPPAEYDGPNAGDDTDIEY